VGAVGGAGAVVVAYFQSNFSSELKYYLDFHAIYSDERLLKALVFPLKHFISLFCDKVSTWWSYRNFPMTTQRENHTSSFPDFSIEQDLYIRMIF